MPPLSLPPPAGAVPLTAGQALGVWRLEQPLPDGEQAHSGQWYSAHHSRAADERGAVLVLENTAHSAGVMLRFADQAGDLASLHHPLIAVPSDSGVSATGQPYLIVEGAHGEPLLPAIHQLGLRRRLELVVQLCEALRSAHQQGWLLADVDPAMVWISPDGRPCLMGLGLVRIPDPTDPFDRGMSIGSSPAFVAPERRDGNPPSLASEAFGVGALLRALVCGWEDTPRGLAPAPGSSADQWPLLPEPEQITLDQLMRRATALEVEDRLPSVEVLADELRTWLGQGQQIVVDAERHSRPANLDATAPKPRARRWRWLWASAAAVLASFGWVAQQQSGTASANEPPRIASGPN
jgi:serine/threonine-protein kinase